MTARQSPINTIRRRLAGIGVASAACALAACQTPPAPDDWSPSVPVVPDPPSSNGSIYQLGRDATLFENATAQRVGDILTIRLIERTSAVKNATTSTSKSTDVEIPGPTIGGRPVTVNGVPILETEISSNQSFDGQGDSAQSNRLDGAITVTVAQRLPNGNLLVRGQKWLTLNQGKEFVRIEGIVRAIDVEPDNSVPSWKVADARIAYGGRGALEDSNSMGWIARFFNSPIMPF
jgi:flagellar L-ring protein precursor FlgH